ncbi:MAG: ECF transporter S component [Oscillospiraceae bacterium]|jgi:uncharacterized membrane protein|nr:ECF transporter S component [Oscillospiraceae bacterium]
MRNKLTNSKGFMVVQIGIMAALCFVGFTYFKIPIIVPGANPVALHLGNVFCLLGALLLGGWQGGLAGAIGMTIADLLDPMYITAAPKTFILKLGIGLVCGLVAHTIGKIAATDKVGKPKSSRRIALFTVLGAVAGMIFNIIFEPVVSFLYNRYLLGNAADVASIFAKWQAGATAINAVAAIIISSLLYLALRPALISAGLFRSTHSEKQK